jgi:hypothetical protein
LRRAARMAQSWVVGGGVRGSGRSGASQHAAAPTSGTLTRQAGAGEQGSLPHLVKGLQQLQAGGQRRAGDARAGGPEALCQLLCLGGKLCHLLARDQAELVLGVLQLRVALLHRLGQRAPLHGNAPRVLKVRLGLVCRSLPDLGGGKGLAVCALAAPGTGLTMRLRCRCMLRAPWPAASPQTAGACGSAPPGRRTAAPSPCRRPARPPPPPAAPSARPARRNPAGRGAQGCGARMSPAMHSTGSHAVAAAAAAPYPPKIWPRAPG